MQRDGHKAAQLDLRIREAYAKLGRAFTLDRSVTIAIQGPLPADDSGCNWRATANHGFEDAVGFNEAVRRVQFECNLEAPFFGASAALRSPVEPARTGSKLFNRPPEC